MTPQLEGYSNDHRPAVRWWWFANTITNDQIDAQLAWIAGQGFGRVEIAWVYSTREDSPPPEFLSAQWSALVSHAARSCGSLGLGCDFTIGTLWPFGGRFVPEELSSRTWTGLSDQRLERSWDQADGGPTRILDHLSEQALEFYVGRITGALSEAIRASRSPALFTDSWEVDPVGLWSDDFDARFHDRFGYDPRPFMPRIDAHPRERYDYRSLVSDLVLERFFEPLTRLTNAAGALARVQAHGAPCDLLDAYAYADVPESETMLFDPPFAAIAASAAAANGRPVVSCEAFTCLYGWVPYPDPGPHHGEELSGDLKLVADAGFANGVNMVVWHGMPFGADPSTDRFYATTHVGPDASFADDLPALNAYFTTVSRALREGATHSRLAVYLATEDAFMRGELPEPLRRPSARWHWEMQHARFPAHLQGYRPLWTNATGLAAASVENGRIVLGATAVDALFVDAQWLPYGAVADLVRLADRLRFVAADRIAADPLVATVGATGSTVAQAGSTVAAADEAPDGRVPEFWCRRVAGEDGDLLRYFFAHPGTRELAYPLEYGISRRLEAVLVRVLIAGPSGDRHEVELRFEPGASVMVEIDSSGPRAWSPTP